VSCLELVVVDVQGLHREELGCNGCTTNFVPFQESKLVIDIGLENRVQVFHGKDIRASGHGIMVLVAVNFHDKLEDLVIVVIRAAADGLDRVDVVVPSVKESSESHAERELGVVEFDDHLCKCSSGLCHLVNVIRQKTKKDNCSARLIHSGLTNEVAGVEATKVGMTAWHEERKQGIIDDAAASLRLSHSTEVLSGESSTRPPVSTEIVDLRLFLEPVVGRRGSIISAKVSSN
jgi:hypothetical protein